MLKLLDRYYIANLSFFNKRYRLIYEIPLIMSLFMSINIISVLLILLPLASDNENIGMIIIWIAPNIIISLFLFIRYSDKKCKRMIEYLKTLPASVVLKYKTGLIVYILLTLGFLFAATWFSKYYTIDWSWLC